MKDTGQSHLRALMAQFQKSCSSMPDASRKASFQTTVCGESSVESRVVVQMRDLSGALNTISTSTTYENYSLKPDFERNRFRKKKPKLVGAERQHESMSMDPVLKSKFPSQLVLGKPPPKPDRPPNVDLRRFQSNRKFLKHGPRMKIQHAAPSLTPPHTGLQPPPGLAAVLMKHEEVLNKHQKNYFGKGVNHDGVTEDKHATKGLVHGVKRGKAPLVLRRARSDCSVDQGGIYHDTENFVKQSSIGTYSSEEEEPGSMSHLDDEEVYDDVQAPIGRDSP